MPYPRKMVQFTQPQLDWLEDRAKELGVSVAEMVRRIVDEYRGVKTSGWKVKGRPKP